MSYWPQHSTICRDDPVGGGTRRDGCTRVTDPVGGPRLVVGDPIEVHTAFNKTWSAGFEIAEVLASGYRV